jgi:hypothetical protein
MIPHKLLSDKKITFTVSVTALKIILGSKRIFFLPKVDLTDHNIFKCLVHYTNNCMLL